VFDIRPPRKPIYLIFVIIGVLPRKFVALHLPEMHDETRKQITICNDDYKFVVYPHSILQEFAVKNMVIVMIHSERFFLETVSQLHARCIVLLDSSGLLPLLVNWISHGILLSIWFSVKLIRLFLLHMPFQIYHRL